MAEIELCCLTASTMSGLEYDADNIFAKIIRGEIPCFKIFETEHALAFLDAFPMAEGHALLIPKALGYATVMDMPPEVAADVLRELPRLVRAVARATGAAGANVVQNNGEAAGQLVFHAHFHVIPRREGDGLVKLGKSAPAMLAPDAAAPVLAKIQAALGPTGCDAGRARVAASASIEMRGLAVGLLAVGVALLLSRRR